MNARERAENIVLATRQDRYAKATVLLDFIAAQISEAEREAIKEHFHEMEHVWHKESHDEGFHAAQEKAAGIAENLDIEDVNVVAERIRKMEP